MRVALLSAFLLCACGDADPRALDWTIVFAEEAVRTQTHLVSASIRRGGCTSTEVVWTTTVREGDLDGMRPPELEPGTWGFAARARDRSCRFIASGCAELELGNETQGASVRTVLLATAAEEACAMDACVEGECVGADAGPPPDAATLDAGPRDARPPDAPMGCTSADDRCEEDTLEICDDASFMITRTSCPLGCATDGSIRCAEFAPSNVDASLLGAGLSDVNSLAGGTIDTDDCTTTLADMMVVGDYCVARGDDVVLDGAWRVVGSRPMILLATGTVEIRGTIDLSARGTTPGAGGFAGGTAAARAGRGGGGGGGGAHAMTFEDGGGGGGALCGDGGDGGDGVTAAGGAGGASMSATWELSPLVGGSGGGAGNGSATESGSGGAGGGALQISSTASITLTGTIHAGGGGGRAGLQMSAGNAGAGGGGGSGGAVLLEAPTITIAASGRIAASGGGGGSGADFGVGSGSAGADGLDSVSRPAGGAATGTSGAGGAGGAGASDDGAAGGNGDNNGGGAGGGVGCVLFRTRDGALPSGTSGFSPTSPPGLRAMRVRTR